MGDGGFVTTNFPHRCGKWTAVVNGGSSPNRKRFRTTAATAFLISTITKQNRDIPQGYVSILVGDGGFVTTNFPHRRGKWTAVVNGGSSPNRKRFRTTAAAAFLVSTISDQNKGIPQGHAFILVGDGGFVTTNFPRLRGKWTAVVNGGSSPNQKRFRTTAAAAFLISTITKQNRDTPQGYVSILVGDGGFGPPKSATTDLQSAPFGHSGNLPYKSSRCVNSLELVIGVEPTTC